MASRSCPRTDEKIASLGTSTKPAPTCCVVYLFYFILLVRAWLWPILFLLYMGVHFFLFFFIYCLISSSHSLALVRDHMAAQSSAVCTVLSVIRACFVCIFLSGVHGVSSLFFRAALLPHSPSLDMNEIFHSMTSQMQQ
ncbi:hypothetical protein M406DRAFT_101141 [Cryphonectria parasitica EP155]|uniref:Uncharacterized protein n=1 Tax=Cryphonectria parasitica (strain ATCC 38755 / EP155) TaxID=660469 RepID=A0A9P4YD71_CRYP1|nr:uncharacterized protein M406DRAFT_101141 [Cryphonectria parasitica EP155]KAF3771193.1 hypothetical protein M406DRAFT_101141 [Cryphonectria parasitica EP155]